MENSVITSAMAAILGLGMTTAYAEGAYVEMYDHLRAITEDAYVYTYKYSPDGSSSTYLRGYLSGYGYYSCIGSLSNVNVNGSAKQGTTSITPTDLYCYGTVPDEVSVECIANGEDSSTYRYPQPNPSSHCVTR